MTTPDKPGDDGFDRIRPQPLQPAQAEPVTEPAASATNGTGHPLFKPALLVLVLLLLAVLFVLPRMTSPAAVPAPQETGKAAEPTANPEFGQSATGDPATPPSAEASLAARQQAQNASQQLDAQRSKLEERAVMRWAPEAYAALSSLYTKAEEQFRNRDYASAESIWRDAILEADNLLEQSAWELLGATQTGQQGLDEGNSELARQGFELALAIDPANKLAQAGLIRAERLDEVIGLLRSARRFEQEKNLIAARDYYAQALKLDPATIAAAAGFQRTHRELQDREFRRLISAALAATEAGKFEDARRQYQAAADIRKDAVEVAEGLAAVQVAEQARAVSIYRREGARFEAKEEWSNAAQQYRSALKTDSTLAFAKAGLSRSEARAKLDGGLQTIIEDPDTLFEEKVQTRARQLLEQARSEGSKGPRLRGQINWMEQALPLATTPVAVKLTSDNRTEVLVYKVGKLGKFDAQTLSLKPGNYTAIGRCSGYRDERVLFSIRPNQNSTAAIDIRCREKI